MNYIEEYLSDIVYTLQFLACFNFFFAIVPSKRKLKIPVVLSLILVESILRNSIEGIISVMVEICILSVLIYYLCIITVWQDILFTLISVFTLGALDLLVYVIIIYITSVASIKLTDFWYSIIAEAACLIFFVMINHFIGGKTTVYRNASLGIKQLLVFSGITFMDFVYIGAVVAKFIPGVPINSWWAHSNFTFLFGIGILAQMILLWEMLRAQEKAKEGEDIARMFLDEQKSHYEYLEQRERDTRSFRHDLRSHILLMQHMLDNGRIAEAEEYLNEMSERINSFGNSITVGNPIVDAIVNRYYAEAKKDGVTLKTDGMLSPDINVSAFDLCTIFSNLFENALDASRTCHGNYINFTIRRAPRESIFSIANKFDGYIQPNSLNSLLLTRKADQANHGFGLTNVKKAVDNNNGDMAISTENNIFCVTISLPLKETHEE